MEINKLIEGKNYICLYGLLQGAKIIYLGPYSGNDVYIASNDDKMKYLHNNVIKKRFSSSIYEDYKYFCILWSIHIEPDESEYDHDQILL